MRKVCKVLLTGVLLQSAVYAASPTSQYAQTPDVSTSRYHATRLTGGQKWKKWALNFHFDHGIGRDTNPFSANKSHYNEEYFGLEYSVSKDLILGFYPVFAQYKYNFDGPINGTAKEYSNGAFPYIDYFFSDRFLGTLELGYLNFLEKQTRTNGVRLETRSNEYFASGFLTYIPPRKVFSYTVRGGIYSRFRSYRATSDTTGTIIPSYHDERAGLYLSARLKYLPTDKYWDAFLQFGGQYALKVTDNSFTYRSTTGKLRRSGFVGPGVHWFFSKGWELRGTYIYNWAPGYESIQVFGLRLRKRF